SFTKFSSSFNNIKLDPKKIDRFKEICGYPKNTDTVPMLYLQSLFIGQFGKYIISEYFPLFPLGLIHTKQKIFKARSIKLNEILNTKLTLDKIIKNEKGLEFTFLLEITSKDELVWEGITTTLAKSKNYKKKNKQAETLENMTSISIIDAPNYIGREYAKVSGDYNPHHLSVLSAKLFGFKRAIAHGMWSLARSVSEIEKHFPDNELVSIDISFKRPVFLPGTIALAAKKSNNTIAFELRDNVTNIPHLAGEVQTR
ncbi:MAG: hypothetical protein GY697_19450, partial [Desulfobacterales bacterium]|nr:hypothetical protein [Desulfobacterales bacterium]